MTHTAILTVDIDVEVCGEVLQCDSVEVEVEFEYTPGYEATFHDPGWPEVFEIVRVKATESIDDQDYGRLINEGDVVTGLLTQQQIKRLTERLEAPEYEY